MANDDYQHPVAVPLMWAVVGALLALLNLQDAFEGDWTAVVIVFIGVFLTAVGIYDLFKRWRRRA